MLTIDELAEIICRKQKWRETFALASGYFNPVHKAHVRYLQASAKFGDHLIVVVNNDHQVSLKGSTPFMSQDERLEIISSLRCVDHAVIAVDQDRSICQTIELLRPDILTNGGDVRGPSQCREAATCNRLGIPMVFGVGGYDKVQSSSDLIRRSIQT